MEENADFQVDRIDMLTRSHLFIVPINSSDGVTFSIYDMCSSLVSFSIDCFKIFGRSSRNTERSMTICTQR